MYAFLAGLAVVALLIPVNRWLAVKIEEASVRMMAHKDVRLQVMGELLRGIHQVKLSAWEPRFIRKVNAPVDALWFEAILPRLFARSLHRICPAHTLAMMQ